jgi:hypothetical protein
MIAIQSHIVLYISFSNPLTLRSLQLGAISKKAIQIAMVISKQHISGPLNKAAQA